MLEPNIAARSSLDPRLRVVFHFLLAAARRLAGHVARFRADASPTATDFRRALREVVRRSIYGVDRNPMALELARVALWLEAASPEAPLSFLDHHFVCGDALLGLIDLEVMSTGIPAGAYALRSGDDAEVAKVLRRTNAVALREIAKRETKKDQYAIALRDDAIASALGVIEGLPDDSVAAVEAKRVALAGALAEAADPRAHPLALAADLYLAAFLSPKTPKTAALVPTTLDLARALDGQQQRAGVVEHARKTVRSARVLHWKLALAPVFARKWPFSAPSDSCQSMFRRAVLAFRRILLLSLSMKASTMNGTSTAASCASP